MARAIPCQGIGRRFESVHPLQILICWHTARYEILLSPICFLRFPRRAFLRPLGFCAKCGKRTADILLQQNEWPGSIDLVCLQRAGWSKSRIELAYSLPVKAGAMSCGAFTISLDFGGSWWSNQNKCILSRARFAYRPNRNSAPVSFPGPLAGSTQASVETDSSRIRNAGAMS